MKIPCLVVAILSSHILFAQIYVSTTGTDDPTHGAKEMPYQTIAYAVAASHAGDTVYIGGGQYNEVNEITITHPLYVENWIGNPVIIDGTSRGGQVVIRVANTSDVTIHNLMLQNVIGNGTNGIYITSTTVPCSNINIEYCRLTNIGWISNNLHDGPTDASAAIAIKVEGLFAGAPLSGVHLLNNKIWNCATGTGEAIELKGNVDNFDIGFDTVYQIANIGIDVAGGWSGVDKKVDYARDGSVHDNLVYECMSPLAISSGIYLDGSYGIKVFNNTVHHNAVGISLGGEQALNKNDHQTGHHAVYNNVVYGNTIFGMLLGTGTNNTDNPVANCTVYNNTLFKNRTAEVIHGIDMIGGQPVSELGDQYGAEICLHNTDTLALENNIIYPFQDRRGWLAAYHYYIKNFSADYNLYFHESNAPLAVVDAEVFFFNEAGMKNKTMGTITDIQTMVNLETHGTYNGPAFKDTAQHLFALTRNSAARNEGDPVYNAVYSGLTDFTGKLRVQEARIDAGAYEFDPATLAVVWGSPFTAYQTGNTVQLVWQTATEVNVKSYLIERSSNGRAFSIIGTEFPKGGNTTNSYTWKDLQPNTGWNYYRIKQTGTSGQYQYSNTAGIQFLKTSKLSIYPNPASGDAVMINAAQHIVIPSKYSIVDLSGRTITCGLLKQQIQKIVITNLAKGQYILILDNGQSAPFVKQ